MDKSHSIIWISRPSCISLRGPSFPWWPSQWPNRAIISTIALSAQGHHHDGPLSESTGPSFPEWPVKKKWFRCTIMTLNGGGKKGVTTAVFWQSFRVEHASCRHRKHRSFQPFRQLGSAGWKVFPCTDFPKKLFPSNVPMSPLDRRQDNIALVFAKTREKEKSDSWRM